MSSGKEAEKNTDGDGREADKNMDDVSAAEMEERLEARLMERVMKKVSEQLASQQPGSSQEAKKKGQCSRG